MTLAICEVGQGQGRPPLPVQTDSQTSFIRTVWYVPIKMCSDRETCGLLNHCKYKMMEEVSRKCVRIVRHTD